MSSRYSSLEAAKAEERTPTAAEELLATHGVSTKAGRLVGDLEKAEKSISWDLILLEADKKAYTEAADDMRIALGFLRAELKRS